MNYTQLREVSVAGDLLLVEGGGLAGTLIRALTAQQISHVALLLWVDEGLWVAEMRNAGYCLTPASQRVPELAASGKVYWGKAPNQVRVRAYACKRRALSFRGTRYSWWSLLSVWAAQILKRHLPRNLVCSTLVEEAWSATGFVFDQTPDPGDFIHLCDGTEPLRLDDDKE